MKSVADKVNELIRAARLYYVDELTQAEISEVMHLHRTEISRMIQEAKRLGIVKISVDSTYGSVTELSEFFEHEFGLASALIIPDASKKTYAGVVAEVGRYADSLLHSLLRSHTTIGVSWGFSLAVFAEQFQRELLPKNVTVVPMIGGPRGVLPTPYRANSIAYQLASKMVDATPFSLDSPALVSSAAVKDELLANPNVSNIMALWQKLDVAVFGIGSNEATATLPWRQFYHETSFAEGLGARAVGDVLSQPFTADGDILSLPDVHIVGMDLADLREVPHRVAIAVGDNKAEAILGALRAGLVTDLVTDYSTATAIQHRAQM